MDKKFDRCLKVILDSMGGFSNNPSDPGYKGGLSEEEVDRIRRRKEVVVPPDISMIDEEKYWFMVRSSYWRRCRCNILPWPIDLMVLGTAMKTKDPLEAIRLIQNTLFAILGKDAIFETNGKFTPNTQKYLNACLEKPEHVKIFAQVMLEICAKTNNGSSQDDAAKNIGFFSGERFSMIRDEIGKLPR